MNNKTPGHISVRTLPGAYQGYMLATKQAWSFEGLLNFVDDHSFEQDGNITNIKLADDSTLHVYLLVLSLWTISRNV